MGSLLALLGERFEDAFHCMEAMRIHREPEVQVYLARHYSYIGSADSAIKALRHAARSGFVCAPDMLRSDPWLSAARAHPEFGSVLAETESLTDQAHSMLQGSSVGLA